MSRGVFPSWCLAVLVGLVSLFAVPGPVAAASADEVVELRSEQSKTFRRSDGRMETKVFGEAVHYRDDRGAWREIDTTLIDAGPGEDAVVSRAGEVEIEVPDRIDADGVKIRHEAHQVELSPLGAGPAAAAVQGSEATFAGAWPGVTLEYRAEATGVKELLRLSDRQRAGSSWRFRLALSDGLRAAETGSGAIEIRDDRDRAVFALPAPFMYEELEGGRPGEESRDVRYRLSGDGEERVVELIADGDWIRSDKRRGTVVVDPTVVLPSALFCEIGLADSQPYSPYGQCGLTRSGDLPWGAMRTVMRFDLAGIPQTAEVLSARMGIEGYTTSDDDCWPCPDLPIELGVHRVRRSWTSAVSWLQYDGANGWNNAQGGGDVYRDPQEGDYDPGAESRVTAHSNQAVYTWDLTRLAQRWVEGSAPNHGVLLRTTRNLDNRQFSVFSGVSGSPPSLSLVWEPKTGTAGALGVRSQPLNDRMSLGVNPANGNVIVSARDVSIAGTGLSLGISRTFNNLSTRAGELRRGWNLSHGSDVRVHVQPNGDVSYFGPGGEARNFVRASTGPNVYTAPDGLNVKLEHADGGDFTLTDNPSGSKLKFDAAGRVVKQLDKNDHEIRVAYGSGGRLGSIVDTQNRTVTSTLSSDGQRVERLTDWTGRTWQYAYGTYAGELMLDRYTDPDGGVTQYRYDASLNLDRITDPEGYVTELEYDGQRRVRFVRHVVDPGAGTKESTEYSYGTGSPCGSTETRTVVRDPRSNDTTYCTDPKARVTKVLDALGHSQRTDYNSAGMVTDTTNALSKTTHTEWETASGGGQRPTYRQLPNTGAANGGAKTNFAYTDSRFPFFPSTITTAQRNPITLRYDAGGNVDQRTAAASETRIDHGTSVVEKGLPRYVYDGENKMSEYRYDAAGNLRRVIHPGTGADHFSDDLVDPDALSRRSRFISGENDLTQYSYDPIDRLRTVDFDGATPTVTYVYDKNGNALSRTDASGTTNYGYDRRNRLRTESFPGGTTNTYTYDAAGNLRTVNDGAGAVTYTYDAADRVTEILEPGESTPIRIGYYDNDQRRFVRFPNGVQTDYTYDNAERVTRIESKHPGGQLLHRDSHVYIKGNNDTDLRWETTDKDGNRTEYDYDTIDRLKFAKTYSGSGSLIRDHSYSYDRAGNLTGRTGTAGSQTLTYGVGNQLKQVTGTGAESYTYSYDGDQRTSSSSRNLAWTHNTADQTTQLAGSGFSTLQLEYRGPGQSELTREGTATFRTSALGVIGRVDGGGITRYTRDPDGGLLRQRATSARHDYLTDALGSVVAMTDANANTANTYRYDPYGKTENQTGSAANMWGYAGGHKLASGHYHFGARYYDPATYRWTQRDPLDQPGDLAESNRYIYAADNPVNLTDPSGLTAPGPRSCAPGAPTGRRLGRSNCPGDTPISPDGVRKSVCLGLAVFGPGRIIARVIGVSCEVAG